MNRKKKLPRDIRKTPRTVSIPDTLYVLVKREARRSGLGISEVIRQAIAAYFQDEKQPEYAITKPPARQEATALGV